MKIFLGLFFGLVITLNASFTSGQKVVHDKCLSCHIEYVPMDTYKKNFLEYKNTLLNLKAPTFNRLAYKILDGNQKIGSSDDDMDIRKSAIEDYLKDFLENPSIDKSLFGHSLKEYYQLHQSMKGQLTDSEYKSLVDYFVEYKQNISSKNTTNNTKSSNKYDEKSILFDAKEQNKFIIVEATSKSCHYCKKMKAEVLSLADVQAKIDDKFIFIEAYIDNAKLPFDLDKKFPKITPTFFFLDNNGKLMHMYPGSWNKKDFIEMLKENKK